MLFFVTFISLCAFISAQESTTLHPPTASSQSHTHAPNETHLLHSEKSHHAEDVIHHQHNKRQVTQPSQLTTESHTHAPNETHLQHSQESHHAEDVQHHVHNKRQVIETSTHTPGEDIQRPGHHTPTPLARALGRDSRQVTQEQSTTTTTTSPVITEVPFQHQKREVATSEQTTQQPEVTTGIPAVFPLNVTIREKREATTVTPAPQQVNETIRLKREETALNPDLTTTTQAPVTTAVPAVFPLNVTILQKREVTTDQPEVTTSHTTTTLRRKRQVTAAPTTPRTYLGHPGEHHTDQSGRSTRDTVVPKEEPTTEDSTTKRTTQLN